jgi:hypothetical protein
MHEKIHSAAAPAEPVASDSNKPKTLSDAAAEFGPEMREYAFTNPALTHEDVTDFAKSGKFSRLLNLSPFTAIHVMLTVSPSDDKNDPLLFWHVSMSYVSLHSGRPKSVSLWTAAERARIRKLLPEFLGDAGAPDAEDYLRTPTALHCTRHFTDEEMTRIGRDGL